MVFFVSRRFLLAFDILDMFIDDRRYLLWIYCANHHITFIYTVLVSSVISRKLTSLLKILLEPFLLPCFVMCAILNALICFNRVFILVLLKVVMLLIFLLFEFLTQKRLLGISLINMMLDTFHKGVHSIA